MLQIEKFIPFFDKSQNQQNLDRISTQRVFFPRNFPVPINQPAQNWTLKRFLFTSARCYFSIRNSRGATWASTPKISISIGNTNQKLKSVRLSHCNKQKVQIFPAFKKTLKTAPINLFIRKTDTSPNTTQNKNKKILCNKLPAWNLEGNWKKLKRKLKILKKFPKNHGLNL